MRQLAQEAESDGWYDGSKVRANLAVCGTQQPEPSSEGHRHSAKYLHSCI